MKTLGLLAFLALPLSAFAQVHIVDSGESTSGQVALSGIYTQNFDSLTSTSSAGSPWTNNITITGWYAYGSQQGIPTRYYPSSGSSISSLSSYGKTITTEDRALGAQMHIGDESYMHFGVQFSNDSSQLINGVTITFDGERWSSTGSSTVDSLVFSYQIFDSGQGSLTVASGWTTVDALTFYTPVQAIEYSTNLDGNLPENRIADISSYLADLSLAPGQEIWLRWTASEQDLIEDDDLAIDNLRVSFTAVPEPASSAALLSLASLGLAGLRRRPRA